MSLPSVFVPGVRRRERGKEQSWGGGLEEGGMYVGRWARDVLGSSCERKVPSRLWSGAVVFLPLHSISRWGRGHSVGVGASRAMEPHLGTYLRKVRRVHPRMTAFNASEARPLLSPLLSSCGCCCQAKHCQALAHQGPSGRCSLPCCPGTGPYFISKCPAAS